MYTDPELKMIYRDSDDLQDTAMAVAPMLSSTALELSYWMPDTMFACPVYATVRVLGQV